LETNLSILDIAIKYDFSSNEVFTRNFKKEFSSTPSDFRRKGDNNQISELIYPDFSTLKLDLYASSGAIINKYQTKHIEKLKLVGAERDSNDEMVSTILPAIEAFIEKAEVIKYSIGDTFYRVCYDLSLVDEVPSFKELIAVEVSKFEDIPKGMICKDFTDVKMIEFVHKGKLFSNENCTVLNTYEMIYKYRIPAIGKQLTNELFIEQYGQDFKGPFSDESSFSIFMSIENDY